jgi:3',5'-cyclic AMP phosphodiesterase CpdA
MKRIILGDPHGNYKTIEDIYNKEQPDMVIILGDYCDSFIHGSPEILASYKKMRKLQRKHGVDTFITLLGNHDWHYINGLQKYSGWKRSTWNAMHDILDSDFNDHILPIVYVDDINKTIYAHAGLTKTWMSEWGVPEPKFVNECNENGLDFAHHSFDMYGDSKWQGPLWVRPGALLSDFYGDNEWKQVVGHTRTRNGKPIVADIRCKNAYERQDEACLFVIDTLPFVYMRETLDDDGKLVSRELVNNVEFNEQLAAQ